MTLEQFLEKYLGQSKGYPEGKFIGECLSIVKLYIQECFSVIPPPSGTNSAYGYWSNFPNPLGTKFEKIENTDTLVPQKGWIVIWKPWESNQYGHIAIIKDANLDTFNSYDQNWGTKIFKEINHNYDNVIGFLKPKESIISDMTDIVSELIKTNGITEGDIRWLIDLKANQTVSNLEKQIEELKASHKNLEERIEQLEADATANNKLIEDYQSSISTAKETESNLRADIQTWKNRYEAKCKETVDKYSAIELIKLGIQKLFIKK